MDGSTFDEWEASRRPWLAKAPAKVCALLQVPEPAISESDFEQCQWCGIRMAEVCDSMPPDTCDRAMDELERRRAARLA